jgi:hypothetical protein
MERRTRFIRMGSKIGAGVIVGAFLAVVPVSPAGATHLANITLSNTVVAFGQPTATLNGIVDNATDAPGCEYGWDIDPVSPASATTDGADFSAPTPGVHWVQPYTVTVNTGSLAEGVYNVKVRVNWLASPGCEDDGDEFASATITVIQRNGNFKCAAYAARTNYDYQPANPNYSPCKDDINYFAQVQPILGFGNVGAVRAITDQQPDVLNSALPKSTDHADAQAHVAGVDVTVAGVRVRTGVLWSRATVTCQGFGMSPKYGTSGGVATVNLDGKAYATTSGYLKVRILNVTIEINKVVSTSTSRTRQALVITRNSLFAPLKVVVAESKVGHSGNPCQR